MSIIQTNQPNWFGSEGAPLKNGYIYVGLPNQDPVAFPQTVTFTDAQGNASPAAQPLRTNDAGQIQYNGKPIQASIDTDYSLLILDSNGTQISGGYIPLVESTAGGGSGVDLTAYTENALTLNLVKQLDVSPGELVRSIGKITADDSLGASWFVVSSTGNPADDVDLIDFDNGLQGIRRLEANIQDSGLVTAMYSDDSVTAQKISSPTAGTTFTLARLLNSEIATTSTSYPSNGGAAISATNQFYFIAALDGVYKVQATHRSGGLGVTSYVRAIKNGVVESEFTRVDNATPVTVEWDISCLKGDLVTLQHRTNASTSYWKDIFVKSETDSIGV